MTPTLPSVHLNGTGRATLAADYGNAYRALVAARDYYPQGPAAYSMARTERDIELHRMGQLMQYLEAHLIHLGE